MSENIINTPTATIIINGGDPLKDCPTTYKEADAIEAKMNEGKGDEEPKWRFDCGFKLDFDGGLVRISSRFYPPKSHSGKTWNGSVSVYMGEVELIEKDFDCETLEELTAQVEAYVRSIRERVESLFVEGI